MNPCIPSDWDKMTIKRVFRGRTYHITVVNISKKGYGVKNVVLNGSPVEGNLIPEKWAKQ